MGGENKGQSPGGKNANIDVKKNWGATTNGRKRGALEEVRQHRAACELPQKNK
jgi:hypothetical protein